MISNLLFPIHLRHVPDQIQHLAGIAPLVIIPGDELHKVAVQHDARVFIEDAGVALTLHIRGYDLILREGDDALHRGVGGLLDRGADFRICRRAAEAGRQVNDGNVVRRHAEAHAREFALELRHHKPDRLGCAGGGRDDVVEHGTPGAVVAPGAVVDRLLLGGRGMNGGHQPLRDSEIVMHDLRKGRKAVRGTARILYPLLCFYATVYIHCLRLPT